MRSRLLVGVGLLGMAALMAALAPPERLLGRTVSLVYLHGAWVWTAIVCLGLSAGGGVLGWLRHSGRLVEAALVLGQTGTFFWVTYLPLSLWTMRATWGGLFLDEPRWRLGVEYALVFVLVQAAIYLIRRPAWQVLLNLAGFGSLVIALASTPSVLHPDSPVLSSGSPSIVGSFFAVLTLCLASAGLFAGALRPRRP